ncbi:hypothetical protein B0T16DRAFT_327054 [Cercophora newfieldiana]|uniref:C3H1-type domain-containing protein n=1 Tax=Cercophora newfieldiana TaxID=92897 RepID=A0AA39YBU9_9PEZI|nr:hypothetical protein B0T16DRAFT_327054 [Cercophora newfieldiana]
MTVCKFWQNGNCRNGNNCRFEHPPKNQPQFTNRFGALANTPAMGSNNPFNLLTHWAPTELPYGLSVEVIQRDLSSDLPSWILSCYGPGKDAPEQLFGGYPREQSFEEVRLHYLTGAASGNPDGALAEINRLYQTAQNQIQTTLSNINGAIQFIVDAGNKHPNRADICKASMPNGGTTGEFAKDKASSTNAFGSTANAFQTNTAASNVFGSPAGGGGFGQPSAMGQKPSPFGAPAFGQPSQPAATSPFGQSATTSAAFGQASTLGAKTNPFGTPAFGQPAQPTGGSAFGQPSQPAAGSVFGQPAATTSAFGQPAATSSAFGQPAALGQKPNPFGAPAGSGQSPFAAAAQQPASSPFGQPAQSTPSPFGQPATTAAASPFGQTATTTSPSTNAFGQQQTATPTASPFGAPAASTNTGFGAAAPAATSAPAANPFGAPAPAQAAPANPFGQPTPPATNPFGAPATQPAAAPAFGSGSGFGGGFGAAPPAGAPTGPAARSPVAQAQGPYAPDATRQHPDLSTYTSNGPDGRLSMFRGRPVVWQPIPKDKDEKEFPSVRHPNGVLSKIWSPNGAPSYQPDTEAADRSVYDDPAVQQQWKHFVDTGRFENGVMPEVPPKREYCLWNF